MALLEVRNITKSFGKTDVLKGISFDLNEGNVLSIIGSFNNRFFGKRKNYTFALHKLFGECR